MSPLKLVFVVNMLCVVATAADAKSPCSVKLKDGTTVQCVDPDAADAGEADHLLASFRQTGGTTDDSYNCFFYIQTSVERRVPFMGTSPSDPRHGGQKINHLEPGADYIGPYWLRSRGYKFQFATPNVRTGGFENGDIILVPGVDNTFQHGEDYVHVGIVWGTRGGQITRIRQKHDPFTGVIDLTPSQFEGEYPPQKISDYPGLYQVFRHPPLTGQVTVKTGYVRHPDGLYATAQQIRVTIFLMTPDGARIGPQPIYPRGYFVAVDGIFHSSGADNFSFEFQDLYDAQGVAHAFDQTIPLHYECTGGRSMSC